MQVLHDLDDDMARLMNLVAPSPLVPVRAAGRSCSCRPVPVVPGPAPVAPVPVPVVPVPVPVVPVPPPLPGKRFFKSAWIAA